MEKMGIIIIRYIITLLFGVGTTASFAGILEKKNIGKLAFTTCFLLFLQGVFFLAFGMEGVVYSYPIHTHIVLILSLIFFFHVSVRNAAICIFLAYMCCQIPAWISRWTIGTIYYSIITEFLVYVLMAGITFGIIAKYAGAPIYELLQGSKAVATVMGIVPVTYYFFDYYATVWTKILYTGNYQVTQFMPFVICGIICPCCCI